MVDGIVRPETAPAPSPFWAAVHGGLGREDGPAASRLFDAPPSTGAGVDCHRPRFDKKAAKSPSCGVVIMDCGNQPALAVARVRSLLPSPDGAAYKSSTGLSRRSFCGQPLGRK